MSVITLFGGSFCQAEKIASMVSQEIGYPVVRDEQIIERASDRYHVSFKKLKGGIHGSRSLLGFLGVEQHKLRDLAYLQATMAEWIRDDHLIHEGFLGHLLPASVSHVLKVCIIAEHDYRVKQAVDSEGLSEKEALRLIEKDDHERGAWTKQLFDAGPWDRSLYDIKIPMHEMALGEAALLIVDNARTDVVATTAQSKKAMDDFVLASAVQIALAEAGHDVTTVALDGNVTITLNKFVIRLEKEKRDLEKIATAVPGVTSAEFQLGPRFRSPGRYEQLAPPRVLLVDDEKEFVHTLSERLLARDIGATMAYDGESALSMIKGDEPQVMVLDLRMPGIDGLEVLRRVKRDHPQVEVIILTGHGSQKDRELAETLGAFAYLQKPTDIESLTGLLRAAQEKAHQAGSASETSDTKSEDSVNE
jgi:CheY-like chemotaxis protein/cytidylate kinase